jgi:uncharacterized protein (TIGR03066 family)
MRMLVAAVVVLGIVGRTVADDTKLNEKVLVGTWTIKLVLENQNQEDKLKKSIEFRADGTYTSETAGLKTDGTYKLNGTTLELTPKDSKMTLKWKDLSIKDGKIIHQVTKNAHNELTKIEKKDKN